jgi:hypothetical protein
VFHSKVGVAFSSVADHLQVIIGSLALALILGTVCKRRCAVWKGREVGWLLGSALGQRFR